MKFTAIKDAPMIRVLGRTTQEREPLTLFLSILQILSK